jgi:hypothetical protein
MVESLVKKLEKTKNENEIFKKKGEEKIKQ